jgi:hypothetical protein
MPRGWKVSGDLLWGLDEPVGLLLLSEPSLPSMHCDHWSVLWHSVVSYATNNNGVSNIDAFTI